MSDLLKRLRQGVEWLRGSRYNGSADLMQEAADEIDRLRDLNRQLVDKANGYVIHNAKLAEENQRLRAELAAPTAQPLTDEQIISIAHQCDSEACDGSQTTAFARAIERAHGIGGTHAS